MEYNVPKINITSLKNTIVKYSTKLVIPLLFMILLLETFVVSTSQEDNDASAVFSHTYILNSVSTSADYQSAVPTDLHAKYAALIDADNGRILYEKNGFEAAPNASTTKVMTLTIALEYCTPDTLITVSSYAASMPDVQLNISTGEQYELKDILYSLMLQSHNDSAVAIAENVGLYYLKKHPDNPVGVDTSPITSLNIVPDNFDISKSSTEQSKALVHIFVQLMNKKAAALNCTSTHFVTPNGLDAQDEEGVHATSAADLARIMSYAIQNNDFLAITETPSYSFCNKTIDNAGNAVNGSRTFNVHNANAFFNMMDGVISGKTGFTGDAGYCYVCALRRDNKTFVSVVLACGWPNNKTYKWADTKKLMNFGLDNYFYTNVFTTQDSYKTVTIDNGIEKSIETSINGDVSMLLSKFDNVNVIYQLPNTMKAPVKSGDSVGTMQIFINDSLYSEIPITAKTSADKLTFQYCLKEVLKKLCIVSLE